MSASLAPPPAVAPAAAPARAAQIAAVTAEAPEPPLSHALVGAAAQGQMMPRDRFLAFAFAAADLLVEATPDGTVCFAAGAFGVRFGAPAESFLGRPASTLIAAQDQAAFALALASVGLRGRIPPMLLRLADARRTPVCVAAMLVPGATRLCVTIGPPPLAAPDLADGVTGDPAPGAVLAEGVAPLNRAAALRMDAGGGSLALVELAGWDRACRRLSDPQQAALRAEIGAALGSVAGGALAGEVAEARFGVLTSSTIDLAALAELLDRLIRATPAAGIARVRAASLGLGAGGLLPAQAARALRFVLSRFAAGGLEAAQATGGGETLADVVMRAEGRTQAVRQMIADRRYRLLFQPVVALEDSATHHFEALLRPIATPAHPIRDAQEFVSFVEVVGLSEELDGAVLDSALALLAPARGPIIAINVSGLSMQSAAFRERAVAAIRAAGRAERLMMELTETAEIEDIQEAAASMAALRREGVRLCLDDFGAGAAAFRYLREFPVDFVKIDGSYVRAASRSPRERGLVAAMAELAQSVGARTVAEMVESPAQAAMMADLGVQFGQGWLYGRPGALPGSLT